MAESRIDTGRRIAVVGVAVSGGLAVFNIGVGLLVRSTSVVAAGVEFAGDVLASLTVLFGMLMASRPPDENHPYGHGRFEILAGLLVGLILVLAGIGICVHALDRVGEVHPPPRVLAIYALAISMAVKTGLSITKFRVGRSIGSAALVADAWNDTVDILSSAVALGAVALTLWDPVRFLSADHWGAFAVGVIVVITGLRVVRDTSLELTDTMPGAEVLARIRQIALEVPEVHGVEKCFARKTGMQYHVDLHIEVDPSMTVAQSHFIAHQVQERICERMRNIAGVLVHIEPTPEGRLDAGPA